MVGYVKWTVSYPSVQAYLINQIHSNCIGYNIRLFMDKQQDLSDASTEMERHCNGYDTQEQ